MKISKTVAMATTTTETVLFHSDGNSNLYYNIIEDKIEEMSELVPPPKKTNQKKTKSYLVRTTWVDKYRISKKY